MERPVVLAMSPRVGRSNHRYLTPTPSGLTEEEAVQWVNIALGRSNPDPSIVHAQVFVPQPSTGRENWEVLLVRDPRLPHCPNDIRKEIGLILAKRLCDFGRFIKGLKDEETASGLLLHHDGFDKLSGAVWRELAPILDALPPAAEEEEPPAPRAVKRTRPSLRAWVVLSVIIVAAALPMGWSALFVQRAAPASNKEDAALREFYFAILGMERDKEIVDEEFDAMSSEQRIAKIRERLVEDDSDKTPEQSESNAPTTSRLTPEDELRSLLAKYYEAIYGSNAPPAGLLGNQDFKDAMSKAFGKQEVDPTAFLNPGTDGVEVLKQFECDGRRHFHEVFNALATLQEAIKNKKIEVDAGLYRTWEADFIVGIHKQNQDILHKTNAPGPLLRIYSQQDAEKALEATKLLQPLFEKTKPPIKTLREKLGEFKREWERDSSMTTAIEKSNVDTRAAFQALKALGDVWLDWEVSGAASPPAGNTPYSLMKSRRVRQTSSEGGSAGHR